MKVRFLLVFILIICACNFLGKPSAPSIIPPVPVELTATLTVEQPVVVKPAVTPSPLPSPNPKSTWKWMYSSPEEQGISSSRLAEMLEVVRQEKRNIHSVLVIRHGVVVLEAYVHPFNEQTRHAVYSVTKSVTSSLVGIALGEGLLGEVNTPVISFFPTIAIDDPRKGNITVEHLLAMSSGIEWNETLYSGLNDHWGILEADDPVKYFFTPALLEEPGNVFNYNSGGSHMLSILVQEVTGQPAAEYASDKLFSPLSIIDYAWEKDFSNHTKGGTGLELKTTDMAKIGQVYLDGGLWQGEQVISANWIDRATGIHSVPSQGMGYGYQWWIRSQGDYYALGWGGQQIRVFPGQDMVVVFTAGMSGDGILHHDLVDNYLLPAVVSDSPLPADAQAQARLENAINALATPQEWHSTPLSRLAQEIDGKQWLVTGVGNWSMFTLHFSGDSEAQIDLTLENDPMPLKIGLDGHFRVTDTGDLGPVALVGYWDTEDTFVLIQQNLREADRRTTRLQFSGDTVKLYSEWIVEPYQEESEAVLFGE